MQYNIVMYLAARQTDYLVYQSSVDVEAMPYSDL